MERFWKLLLVVFLLLSILPLYYLNKWLQQMIRPHQSFGQFIIYLLLSLVLVFVYTFLLVLVVSKLFPLPKR